MNCIKCGKDTASEQLFCEECQLDMDKHPVKPGTPILLPHRTYTAPPKRSKKHTLKPEDQIRKQKSVIFWLVILIMTLIIALTFTITTLLQVMEIDVLDFLPGQNFITESTAAPLQDR